MLKIGVAGAGHLGKIHIKLIKQIEDYTLIGFYDHNPEVAQKVAAEFNVPSFNTFNELVKQCDVIDIVTPTLSHFELASQCIAEGKHVFIEKPITTTVEEAETLIELKNKYKVSVQVGHVERFNPAYAAVQQYLSNPLFIETHRLAEFNPRGTDVSVVHDLMIHDLDIVLSTVRSPLTSIHASGVAIISDTPDIANARIEFENGCVANLTASRISLKNMRKMRFFQRDAYLSVDFLDKKAEIVRLKSLQGEPGPLDIVIDLGESKGSKIIYIENPKIPASNAIQSELLSFAESIANKKQVAVTAEDAANALKTAHQVMSKINQSLKTFA